MDERKSRYELFLEEEEKPQTKRCSKCKVVKALSEFHKDRNESQGVNSACKVCRSQSRSKYKSEWQRFWSRVTKQNTAPFCWIWGNSKSSTKTYWRGQHRSHQHVAYEMTTGELPDDARIITSCRNHRCINPSHMRAVTRDEFFVWMHNQNSDRFMGSKRPGTGLKGERNYNTRLTEEQVKYIRLQAAEGRSHADLARELGYSNAGIGFIVRGVNWGHVQDMPTPAMDRSHFVCPHCGRNFHASKTVAHVEKCLDQISRARNIRDLLAQGQPKTAIAAHIGITRQRVTQILTEMAHVQ